MYKIFLNLAGSLNRPEHFKTFEILGRPFVRTFCKFLKKRHNELRRTMLHSKLNHLTNEPPGKL